MKELIEHLRAETIKARQRIGHPLCLTITSGSFLDDKPNDVVVSCRCGVLPANEEPLSNEMATMEEAIDAMASKISDVTPASKAARLEAKAAELLAEAAELRKIP